MSQPNQHSGAEQQSAPVAAPDDFWTLFDRTVYLCLRVAIIVGVCGLIMWYGFQRDQRNAPAADLIDPDDYRYTAIQEHLSAIAQQQQQERDPIFDYHEMNKPAFDTMLMDGGKTAVGTFETEDEPQTVYRHYYELFRHRGFNVSEDLRNPRDQTLTGIAPDSETHYIVRVQTKEDGSARVHFSRREQESKTAGTKWNYDDDFPKPAGDYEVFTFAINPGQAFGSTCQYFSSAAADINFRRLERELLDRGWQRSTLSYEPYDPASGASIALFRRREHTLMLNVAPSRDEKWASVVAMTIF